MSKFLDVCLDIFVFLIAFALISGIFPTVPVLAILIVSVTFAAFRTALFDICKTQLYITNFK